MLMRDIQKRVAAHYGIPVAELLHTRDWPTARKRQVAYALCRALTDKSTVQIGRAFSRDHSTIISGARGVFSRCDADKSFDREMAMLAREIAL